LAGLIAKANRGTLSRMPNLQNKPVLRLICISCGSMRGSRGLSESDKRSQQVLKKAVELASVTGGSCFAGYINATHPFDVEYVSSGIFRGFLDEGIQSCFVSLASHVPAEIQSSLVWRKVTHKISVELEENLSDRKEKAESRWGTLSSLCDDLKAAGVNFWVCVHYTAHDAERIAKKSSDGEAVFDNADFLAGFEKAR
jgi:hypothetical protein